MIQRSGCESYFPCKLFLALSCSTARSVSMVLSWGLSHGIFFPWFYWRLYFFKAIWFHWVEYILCYNMFWLFSHQGSKEHYSFVQIKTMLLVIISIIKEFNTSLKIWDIHLNLRRHFIFYWYLPCRSVFHNQVRKMVRSEKDLSKITTIWFKSCGLIV